jgi:hypothetical protein
MISIKNCESVFAMGISTIEGIIRQNTENKLTLLDFSEPVEGTSIVIIDDMVHVETPNGNIPIYMFKMNKNLQNILNEYYDIWNS